MDNTASQLPFRRFLPMVIALVVLPVVGTVGYRWIEDMNTLDALYMTITTISTVGFGEVKPLSPAGRIFTMGLIVSGVGLAAYSLSNLAHIIVTGEWRAHWEHRRQVRLLSKLTNHIIVCGYGRVGRRVVTELRDEGLPFVVIDLSADKIAQLEAEGHLGLLGDAAHDTNLRSAGIERARGLIASAKSDAENVFIVLTARSLRADLSIVARADFEESEPKLLRAGANKVILPYHITGRRMVTMLVRPDVADFLDEVSHTGGLELLLEQIQVRPGSTLIAKTVAQLQSMTGVDLTVIACKPAGGTLKMRPNGDFTIEANMQLMALGTGDQLKNLMKLAQP